MVNQLDSNTTRKVIRVFLDAFESSRVVTKTVNTQLLSGEFDPQSGENVDFKRPHQYRVVRTPDGDLTSETENNIIAGKATGTVQDYFTADIPYKDFERALKLDQFEEIIAPAARQIVTDLEVDLGRYMTRNAGLSTGTYGTGTANWSDVAESNALLDSVGVPMDADWCYVYNPFSRIALANTQATTIAPGSGTEVQSAFTRAQIASPFAGMKVMSSNALPTLTQGDSADREGTLAATPDGTYLTAKDTMTQQLSLTGFSANAVIRAGEVLRFTGEGTLARTRLNISTREEIIDAAGAPVKWQCTVTEDVTLDGTGAGVVTVASAAINEPNGQYNNISAPLEAGDVVSITGTANAKVQPSLFYHTQAFGIGTVELNKLNTWDTVFTTEDGFSIRMTMYSDGKANSNNVRFDLLPAYATFNPNFAGLGFGS